MVFPGYSNFLRRKKFIIVNFNLSPETEAEAALHMSEWNARDDRAVHGICEFRKCLLPFLFVAAASEIPEQQRGNVFQHSRQSELREVAVDLVDRFAEILDQQYGSF